MKTTKALIQDARDIRARVIQWWEDWKIIQHKRRISKAVLKRQIEMEAQARAAEIEYQRAWDEACVKEKLPTRWPLSLVQKFY